LTDLQEAPKDLFLSFRRIPDRGPGQAPESSSFIDLENTWTPVFTEVTAFTSAASSMARILPSAFDIPCSTFCGLLFKVFTRCRELKASSSEVPSSTRTPNVIFHQRFCKGISGAKELWTRVLITRLHREALRSSVCGCTFV
jgi:hypothetical protein